MRTIFFTFIFCTGITFAQDSGFWWWGDDNYVYAVDLNGTDETVENTGVVNLDLSGSQRITLVTDRTFEDSLGNYTGNGNHSIDTSSVYANNGTYSGKTISTGAGDGTTNYVDLPNSVLTDFVDGEKYTLEINARSIGTLGSDLLSGWDFTSGWNGVGIVTAIDANSFLIDSPSDYGYEKRALMTVNSYYKLVTVGTSTSGDGYQVRMSDNGGLNSVLLGTNDNTYIFEATKPNLYIRKGASSTLDTLTFTTLELYKITPAQLTAEIGSKSKTWTTDPTGFSKLVWNFQATASEVGQDIKLYSNQADTVYIDDVSLTQAYDAEYEFYVKTSDANGVIYNRLASSTGLKLEVASSKLKATLNTTTITSSSDVDDGTWKKCKLTIDRTGNGQWYIADATDGSAVDISGVGDMSNSNTLALGSSLQGLLGKTTITINGTIQSQYLWEGSNDATFLQDETGNNDLTGNNVTQADDQVKISGGYK